MTVMPSLLIVRLQRSDSSKHSQALISSSRSFSLNSLTPCAHLQNCFILVDKCPGGAGISGGLVASFFTKVGIWSQFFRPRKFLCSPSPSLFLTMRTLASSSIYIAISLRDFDPPTQALLQSTISQRTITHRIPELAVFDYFPDASQFADARCKAKLQAEARLVIYRIDPVAAERP
jgi:hypothetical protein